MYGFATVPPALTAYGVFVCIYSSVLRIVLYWWWMHLTKRTDKVFKKSLSTTTRVFIGCIAHLGSQIRLQHSEPLKSKVYASAMLKLYALNITIDGPICLCRCKEWLTRINKICASTTRRFRSLGSLGPLRSWALPGRKTIMIYLLEH